MVTYIKIDTILSDPLLLTAAILLAVGPLLFLVSLWKLIRTPKKKDPLFDEVSSHEEPIIKKEGHPISSPKPEAAAPSLAAPEPEGDKPTPHFDIPEPTPPPQDKHIDMEKTVVMPAGMAEIQGQLEIAFSQIKHLNKKVFEFEKILSTSESIGSRTSNDSTEGGATPSEINQKLLKIAEHVIVLEKNMARLMAKQNAESTLSPSPKSSGSSSENPIQKPPIMPL